MGATFKQPEIPIRERLNELECLPAKVAQNTQALLPLQAYAGKNLLINADKSISQRGVYTSATAIVSGTYYVDRFIVILATVTATIQHKPFSQDAQGSSLLYTATSTATGSINHHQRVEDYTSLAGKEITYTARVKSNLPVYVQIQDGVNTYNSTKHTGSGEYETLTITGKVDAAATQLRCYVFTGSISITSGDYFEVGNEQLEIGSEFTGFEYVDTTLQIARCRRYGVPIKAGLILAARQTLTTQVTVLLPSQSEMRVAPVLEGTLDVRVSGNGANQTVSHTDFGTPTVQPQGLKIPVNGLTGIVATEAYALYVVTSSAFYSAEL